MRKVSPGPCCGTSRQCGCSSSTCWFYLVYGLASGHFRRALLPIRPQAIGRDLRAALSGHLAHKLGERNAVQKAMYVGVVAIIVLTVLSGPTIWKPGEFQARTAAFGGDDRDRHGHFLC